ncbi:MAG: hypothetical protein JXA97_01095 [Anaerolineales bacterium]|nr:hypothetical protein [Anaerolineales bacterium]
MGAKDGFSKLRAIPVEENQGVVLLVSGEKDQMWPSTPMTIEILQRLEANQFKQTMNISPTTAGITGW